MTISNRTLLQFGACLFFLLSSNVSDAQIQLSKRYPFGNDRSYFNIDTIFLLKNQYAQICFDVTNESRDSKLAIDIRAPREFSGELREIKALGNWYSKNAKLVNDPLVLVSRQNSGYKVEIPKGSTKRFYYLFRVPNAINNNHGTISINVQSSHSSKNLAYNYNIGHKKQPRDLNFNHIAFSFLDKSNMKASEILEDLDNHFTTMVEFTLFPKVNFATNGEIISQDWRKVNDVLKEIAKYPNFKVLVFWEPYYSKFSNNGTFLKVNSTAWKKAYRRLLQQLTSTAEKLGISKDRIVILPYDELSSNPLAGKELNNLNLASDLSKIIKTEDSQLSTLFTYSNNTLVDDIISMYSYSNYNVTHWPVLPTQKNSKNPNQRQEIFDKLIPLLSQAEHTKSKFLLYHIGKGKSADIFTEVILLPIYSALYNRNGVGWWAYNAYNGSSWDDADSKKLDYSFIYNGRQQNVFTDEPIVPSVRWEGVRYSFQVVFLLNALEQATKSSLVLKQYQAVKSKYLQAFDDFGISPNIKLTAEEEYLLSQQLAKIWNGI